jgi:hypothetical protein
VCVQARGPTSVRRSARLKFSPTIVEGRKSADEKRTDREEERAHANAGIERNKKAWRVRCEEEGAREICTRQIRFSAAFSPSLRSSFPIFQQ